MTDADAPDISALKARLEEERAEILASSGATASDRAPVELDQQSVGRLSRMDALQMQSMAQAQEARRRARLPRIDAALRRIAEDEFGYCVSCGEPIAAQRLDIDPATPACVDCAR